LPATATASSSFRRDRGGGEWPGPRVCRRDRFADRREPHQGRRTGKDFSGLGNRRKPLLEYGLRPARRFFSNRSLSGFGLGTAIYQCGLSFCATAHGPSQTKRTSHGTAIRV
jgi:hypothetical protein